MTSVPSGPTDAGPAENPNALSSEELQDKITDFANQTGLEKFFPKSSGLLQTIAVKAAALQKSDPTGLGSPENVNRLTRLALYRTIIYCDDSTSMTWTSDGRSLEEGSTECSRYFFQTQLVRRIARIATTVDPNGTGVELRFINGSPDDTEPNLSEEKVMAILAATTPKFNTFIGTQLKEKILKPFVYDPIEQRTLERPVLICIITDGAPSGGDPPLSSVIEECRKTLNDWGYRESVVRFCISQIGNDKHADNFLKDLREDEGIKHMIHCTTDQLDARYKEMKLNERQLDSWLLKLLTRPIMGLGPEE